jgi:hypothetical protein
MAEQDPSPLSDEKTSSRVAGFGWRAGLGLNRGNFTLDGVVYRRFCKLDLERKT